MKLLLSLLICSISLSAQIQLGGANKQVKGELEAVNTKKDDAFDWTAAHTFTNLQDKGGQVFNVDAYGAIPDDATDDLAAFSSALTAANAVENSVVLCSGGQYLFSSTWVFNTETNITIKGPCTIKMEDASDTNMAVLVQISSTKIVFKDIVWDGNFINQTSGLGRGVDIVNSSFIGFVGNTFKNFRRDTDQSFAIHCLDTPYCVVRDNLFYGNGHGDIVIQGTITNGTRDFTVDDADTTETFSDFALITGNTFGQWQITQFPASPSWDRRNGAEVPISVMDSRGSIIADNIIYSSSRNEDTDMRGRGILVTTATQLTITGNTINGFGNGEGTLTVTNGVGTIVGVSTNFSSASSTNNDIHSFMLIEDDTTLYRITVVTDTLNVTVTPVIVRANGSGLRYKIVLSGDLLLVNDISNSVISNNTIEWSHDMGISLGNNNFAGREFKNNAVVGNTIRNSYACGIVCDGECNYNIFTGNLSINNGQGRSQVPAALKGGLCFLDNGSKNIINANMFVDDQVSPTQEYGIVEETGDIHSDNLITNNFYEGNNTANILLDGESWLIEDQHNYTFATLPTVKNGSRGYCSDCAVTSNVNNTCAGSGSGAFWFRIQGAFECLDADMGAGGGSGGIDCSTPTLLTISVGGSVTLVGSGCYRIDTNGAASSDDLDDVVCVAGEQFIFRAESSARTVIIKNDGVSIFAQADFQLDNSADKFTGTCWSANIVDEDGRSNNGS